MPGSILNADINFPHFTGNETTETKIDAIQNYLYMLYEQLRYSMGNLGTENFSEGGIKDLEKIVAKNIDLTGFVTFNSLSEPGQTVINGANISTGTISADRLSLTGAITWDDLTQSAQQRVDRGKGDPNPSYIHSTYISATEIRSPTIMANEFDILPSSQTDWDGTFNIYSNYNPNSPIFQILYQGSFPIGPGVQLHMPLGGDIYLGGLNDMVKLSSKTCLTSGYNYGTSLPGSGTEGQLFFVILGDGA